jgi:spore coat polysaccharide biosynthesis protein SpsF
MKSNNKHLRRVAIIQARMGSIRLPGKVLADIQGHPMLLHVLQRTRAAGSLNEVMIATTTEPADDVLAAFCEEQGVGCFRGQEKDVLDRYYKAACETKADVIVRITSDCPMIDPEIIDKTVLAFLAERPDYASNSSVRTYPRGLDTEVMTFAALQTAWREAHHPYQRAHVTPYIYENPMRFRILSVTGEKDHSSYRWSVDTQEDLDFVRTVYSRFGDEPFRWNDAVRLMEREPALSRINRSVAQKDLYQG